MKVYTDFRVKIRHITQIRNNLYPGTYIFPCFNKLTVTLHWEDIQVPWVGLPSWALTRVQCSEMFIMTRGWSETDTLPGQDVDAITPPPGPSTSILPAISFLKKWQLVNFCKIPTIGESTCVSMYFHHSEPDRFKRRERERLHVRMSMRVLFLATNVDISWRENWISSCDHHNLNQAA